MKLIKSVSTVSCSRSDGILFVLTLCVFVTAGQHLATPEEPKGTSSEDMNYSMTFGGSAADCWYSCCSLNASLTIAMHSQPSYTPHCNYYGKCAVEMSLMAAAIKHDAHSTDLLSEIYNVLCGKNA